MIASVKDWVCALALLAAAAPPAARAAGPETVPEAALAVEVQRLVLPNGLVVLLAPDPTAESAAVWMSFRAGALYEPAGRAGLAHLVEHVMAVGPSPETDYAGILERRRVQFFNASTGFDRMTFEALVPAEELPAALWVTRDRLTAVPPLVDEEVVERSRRAVLEERALRDVDAPYGLFGEHVLRRVYAAPHPLHLGVIGDPGELSQVTAEDVRRFAAERLVPANAILTVVGRFEPEDARRQIEALFADLPAGSPARVPALPPLAEPLVDRRQEPLGRCPRVTVAWRFQGVAPEDAAALELGAQFLTMLTDQAFDMRVGAEFVQYDGESVFFLDVIVPYDEPMSAVHADAEGFLRQLTLRAMPADLVLAGNLALDRLALETLDSVAGRAGLLTAFEHRYGARFGTAQLLSWHWRLEPSAIRDTARQHLRGKAIEVHARPTRPRKPHLEHE